MADEADVAPSATETETEPLEQPEVLDAKDDGTDVSSTSDEADTDAKAGDEPAAPKSLLEAVQAANEKDGAKTESSPVEEAESDGAVATAETDGQKATEPEQESVPFHKHPAWQKKLRQERELKSSLDELKPKAEEFEKIVTWARDNSLDDAEFVSGMKVMAAMKNDPFEALKLLTPYWDQLQKLTGNVLPADLKQKVDEGMADEESAREMSRLRSQAAHNETQRAAENARWQQQQQAGSQKAMADALNGWETNQTQRDPDYAVKRQPVSDRLSALISQRGARTPQEVVALAEQAYTEVNAWTKSIAPQTKKPAIRTATSVDASSATARPQPRSLREAVAMG